MQAQPRDGLVMSALLRDMGVAEHEPRVINQMLELAFRYSTEVLDDAKALADLAGHSRLEPDDVALALDARAQTHFAPPPPRDLLLQLAKERNAQPLPPIRTHHGLRLPPDRHCLTHPNYRLRSHATISRLPQSLPPATLPFSVPPATLPFSIPPPSPSTNAPTPPFLPSGSGPLKRKLDDDEDYDQE